MNAKMDPSMQKKKGIYAVFVHTLCTFFVQTGKSTLCAPQEENSDLRTLLYTLCTICVQPLFKL